ncbi:hypothetical protein BDN72DRAFT_957713 [Pluteus cervinus]|uniref:Uncharacterized protein n=1 Tax=Pluteus cervinus TaxID=181527 RepID=A0ACD3B2N0_9AGAR|nr:hypothetical protein BDN72DRAFT_957713 [Pluteus cervinus]
MVRCINLPTNSHGILLDTCAGFPIGSYLSSSTNLNENLSLRLGVDCRLRSHERLIAIPRRPRLLQWRYLLFAHSSSIILWLQWRNYRCLAGYTTHAVHTTGKSEGYKRSCGPQ